MSNRAASIRTIVNVPMMTLVLFASIAIGFGASLEAEQQDSTDKMKTLDKAATMAAQPKRDEVIWLDGPFWTPDGSIYEWVLVGEIEVDSFIYVDSIEASELPAPDYDNYECATVSDCLGEELPHECITHAVCHIEFHGIYPIPEYGRCFYIEGKNCDENTHLDISPRPYRGPTDWKHEGDKPITSTVIIITPDGTSYNISTSQEDPMIHCLDTRDDGTWKYPDDICARWRDDHTVN
ncbi:hypothetical protein C0581_05225 [Candidatus Parcubacteria bacterium]|nr:MAG: hypothetical protein C0581_05225 [Candidatus Parcubacteria bacterium]